MDLRYRLAVVTGSGTCPGTEIAVALSRAGAAVLCADPDLAAAERTAALVGRARVPGWPLQVDPADECDLLLLAARGRDLGGVDLLVHVAPAGTDGGTRCPTGSARAWSPALDLGLWASLRLTHLFLNGLHERRGRRDGTPAMVSVAGLTGRDGAGAPAPRSLEVVAAGLAGFTAALSGPAGGHGARVMAVVPLPAPTPGAPGARPGTGATAAEVSRVVLDLLRRGPAGAVVQLAP